MQKIPITQGIRELRESKIPFEVLLYNYEEHGGTKVAARELNINEEEIIKTIVTIDEKKNCYIVLISGIYEVSLKNFARILGVKEITLAPENIATKKTGYIFGGTGPFGLKTPLPIYIDDSLQKVENLYINAGKRGVLVKIKAKEFFDYFKNYKIVSVSTSST